MSAVVVTEGSSCLEDEDSWPLSLEDSEMLDEDDDADKPYLPPLLLVPFAVTFVLPAPLPPVPLYADDETDLPDGQ